MKMSNSLSGRWQSAWLCSGAAVLFAAVSGSLTMAGNGGIGAGADESMPGEMELIGVVRDFRERTHPGGHPDFEREPDHGFGHYMGNIREALGDDGKPVFVGGGFHVTQQWTDAAGLPVFYKLYDSSRGDIAGRKGAASTGGIRDAASFNQWFRDVPGVNLSRPLTLKLVRNASGSYVFDDEQEQKYRDLGGFFPIDDELFGNPGGRPDHNFHFTFELHTEFTYDASANQVFRFIGDDDVWVFVDGRLVIDIGGVHAAVDQYVELNRLGLVDGETYTLDFFFAERHRTQSNFRIETNLKLENRGRPTITGGYD